MVLYVVTNTARIFITIVDANHAIASWYPLESHRIKILGRVCHISLSYDDLTIICYLNIADKDW